ncbi:MAG: VWA domain-containing protein [Terriglobales bacterium]
MRAAGLIFALALMTASPLFARQKVFHFSAHSWLVVEAVTATGPHGEPISGLTAKDFIVTEDGVRQTIAFCRYQRLDAATPAAAAPPPAPAQALTSVQIAPVQHPGRRLVALYFDMTSMRTAGQLRALAAAQAFVAGQLKPADEVAIMEYAGAGVQVKLDFTADRDALQHALSQLTLAALGYHEEASDDDTADTGSAFGQDSSEFNIFNTNRQLAAVRTALDMLAPIEQKKSLVYFASGINLQGVDNEAQLEATTNAALRANVAIFPVDARGLVAAAPLGDATQGSAGGISMYNGSAAAAFGMRLQSSQDSLYALAADTGGKAELDDNNLVHGIATARNAISDYYLIGYYTSDAARNGKYRHVRILVPRQPHLRLAYRQGYFAQKVFAKFTAADKERQLEDALMLGNPVTDLTLALRVFAFQLNPAEYFVPVAVKIPGRELALAEHGGARQATIDFIGEVKDNYGTTITNLRDQVKLKLSGKTVAQLAQVPIEYTAGFTLLPGRYAIKVLARDDVTGRIGTYMTGFTVPNLMRPAPGLTVSSVVLSSERLPVSAALFNANKTLAGDPLVFGGRELMPSVTRVFSRAAPIYVYLEAYEHPPETASPVAAYVGFYRSGKLAYRTALAVTAAAPKGDAGAIPIFLAVPAGALTPGRYIGQVTVLDARTQRAAVRRTLIAIR